MGSKIIDARTKNVKSKTLQNKLKNKIILLTEENNESESVICKLTSYRIELEELRIENLKLKKQLNIS